MAHIDLDYRRRHRITFSLFMIAVSVTMFEILQKLITLAVPLVDS